VLLTTHRGVYEETDIKGLTGGVDEESKVQRFIYGGIRVKGLTGVIERT